MPLVISKHTYLFKYMPGIYKHKYQVIANITAFFTRIFTGNNKQR